MVGFQTLARFSLRFSRSPNLLLTSPPPPLPPAGFRWTPPMADHRSTNGRRDLERFPSVKMYAFNGQDLPKWWERNVPPNTIDIHSTEDFLNALNQADDKLVMVEFYGTWCASCKALFPKLCRTVAANTDILFLKVNFDENKPMCKRLNVKVLPYFHFYRGADGLLDTFSCSLPKFKKIKDAIETHSSERCSISPANVWDLNLLEASTTVNLHPESSPG